MIKMIIAMTMISFTALKKSNLLYISSTQSTRTQLVTQRCNLRSRENLNVPARYLDDQKQKNDEANGKLKRKKSGKKSIITMQMNQINKLIKEHGSRTKLKFLHGKLLEAQSEVTDLHEQLIEELSPDDPFFNDDWIAEVNIVVDAVVKSMNRIE